GTDVAVIREPGPAGTSDGMMTAGRDILLCISVADCAGVLLYDPEHEAVAGLHSGWRGTAGNIVAAGIGRMQREFGTRPEQMLAYVSACASGERYIVREDVAGLFPEDVKKKVSEEEWLLDNRAQVVRQLHEAGIRPDHV